MQRFRIQPMNQKNIWDESCAWPRAIYFLIAIICTRHASLRLVIIYSNNINLFNFFFFAFIKDFIRISKPKIQMIFTISCVCEYLNRISLHRIRMYSTISNQKQQKRTFRILKIKWSKTVIQNVLIWFFCWIVVN